MARDPQAQAESRYPGNDGLEHEGNVKRYCKINNPTVKSLSNAFKTHKKCTYGPFLFGNKKCIMKLMSDCVQWLQGALVKDMDTYLTPPSVSGLIYTHRLIYF